MFKIGLLVTCLAPVWYSGDITTKHEILVMGSAVLQGVVRNVGPEYLIVDFSKSLPKTTFEMSGAKLKTVHKKLCEAY